MEIIGFVIMIAIALALAPYIFYIIGIVLSVIVFVVLIIGKTVHDCFTWVVEDLKK